MFITEEELQKRMSSSKNLMNLLSANSEDNSSNFQDSSVRENTTKVDFQPLEPKINTPQVKSEGLRVVAAVASKIDGVENTARSLGLTTNQVNSAKESTKISSLVEQKLVDIEELALQRTIEALGLLTPDRVNEEKPRDIAAIADKMSRVVRNIRGDRSITDNRTQFIVFSPALKEEKDYLVIESDVA